jgi:uncharacterized membrane protein YdfJ with MMPL/SSD domain
MSFSNSKSFIVRSICATLIAALLLALFAMTAFAGAKNEDQTPSEETKVSEREKQHVGLEQARPHFGVKRSNNQVV